MANFQFVFVFTVLPLLPSTGCNYRMLCKGMPAFISFAVRIAARLSIGIHQNVSFVLRRTSQSQAAKECTQANRFVHHLLR